MTDPESTPAKAAGRRSTGSHSPRTHPGSSVSLPPTARRLLEAARRLLEANGYNALSLETIGREAGENKALIRYYFGSKAGLLIALVEWLVRDQLADMRAMFAGLPEGDGRAHALVQGNLRMVEDSAAYRLYFDLVPNLLRDPKMRAQLAGYYATCRQLNLWGVLTSKDADPNREAAAVAAMTLALCDGLALQRLADPLAFDAGLAWSLWERFIAATLAEAAAVKTL